MIAICKRYSCLLFICFFKIQKLIVVNGFYTLLNYRVTKRMVNKKVYFDMCQLVAFLISASFLGTCFTSVHFSVGGAKVIIIIKKLNSQLLQQN